MSDEVDKESRTEEATERKLQKAAERGDAPVSREATVFAGFLAFYIFLAVWAHGAGAQLATGMHGLLESAGAARLGTLGDAQALMAQIVAHCALALAPALGLIALAGVLASVLQNPPRLVGDRIQPDLSRLSPMKGFARIFGLRGWAEFGKSALKLILGLLVISLLFWGLTPALIRLTQIDPMLTPQRALDDATSLALALCCLSGVIFAADLFWSRMTWRRDQRMSRQELRDEFKETEGDPTVKQRLRALAQQRARKRMMAAVPRATMVIANPTHFAIALRYVRGESGAPVVLAKGQDLVALKIREIAEKNGIPVVEDKALARSMYDAVEIDQMIPAAFYRAVAEIIHMLAQKKTQQAGGR